MHIPAHHHAHEMFLARHRPAGPSSTRPAEPATRSGGDTQPPPEVAAAPRRAAGGAGLALTLKGLLKAWGQSDSPYDLNGDKTVDVQDMTQFILNWPPQSESAPAEDPIDVASKPDAPPPTSSDVEAELRTPETAPGARSPQPTAAPTATPDRIEPPQPEAPPLTLKGLYSAWGQNDPIYDFNGDQTVDIQDLSHFILNWPRDTSGTSPDEKPPAVQAESAGARQLAGAPPRLGRLSQLSAMVIDRLVSAGFEQQPPTNINELVDALRLDPAGKKFVLSRLAERYPQGLGVNVVG